MIALFKSQFVHLSTSFALFLIALPLVSIGTTGGPPVLLWLGFAALCVGGLIPPTHRLLAALKPPSASTSDDKSAH